MNEQEVKEIIQNATKDFLDRKITVSEIESIKMNVERFLGKHFKESPISVIVKQEGREVTIEPGNEYTKTIFEQLPQ